MQLTEQVRKL